jgi:adenosylhomocysteine nucleosidase
MMIGIVAVRQEAEPLLRQMEVEEESTAAGSRFFKGDWQGKPVVLAECGIGKLAAALATQLLLERWRADVLISCGTAGALHPDLAVGDLLIVSRVLAHDQGLFLADGLKMIGFSAAQPHSDLTYLRALEADTGLAAKACRQAEKMTWKGPAPQCHSGPLASGDQVILSAAKKEAIRRATGALAVEMETAAVAYTAYLHHIPWLAIRGISDQADEESGLDYTPLLHYADSEDYGRWTSLRLSLKRLAVFCASPRMVLRLAALNRNLALATGRAGLLLNALIVNEL